MLANFATSVIVTVPDVCDIVVYYVKCVVTENLFHLISAVYVKNEEPVFIKKIIYPGKDFFQAIDTAQIVQTVQCADHRTNRAVQVAYPGL